MIARIVFLLLALGVCQSVFADIWKWKDANGDVHYVTSDSPIYTWIDDDGKLNWADKPGYEGAVQVRLIWHSETDNRNLSDSDIQNLQPSTAVVTESAVEKTARESMEAFHCERATQIYHYYVDSERLYNTDESGKKHYLSKQEKRLKTEEVKASMEEWCS